MIILYILFFVITQFNLSCSLHHYKIGRRRRLVVLDQPHKLGLILGPPGPIGRVELNNKLITISPCGLHGYYLLGISSYIIDNYNLNNYIFSGTSAGAWISLIFSYKGNHQYLINDILSIESKNITNIKVLGHHLKSLFLTKYKTEDFYLNKIFISVTEINTENFIIDTKLVIHNNFKTLEDAVECCIASSHIPLVTGNLYRKYKNKNTIDGGFSHYPYLNTTESSLHIYPFTFKTPTKDEYECNQLKLFVELFMLTKLNFSSLYNDGYNDASQNKQMLDKIFTRHTSV